MTPATVLVSKDDSMKKGSSDGMIVRMHMSMPSVAPAIAVLLSRTNMIIPAADRIADITARFRIIVTHPK